MTLYPLFPLELVVFPLEELNLHVFEPRYKQLVRDCIQYDSYFGIPTFRKGHALNYGCLVRVESIEKEHSDGRIDIKTKGMQVLRVEKYLEVHPNKLYPGGSINILDLDLQNDEIANNQIKEKLLELYSIMNITSIPKALDQENFYTTQIAHKVGFNFDQEYYFLQIQSEMERQEYMLNHLHTLIPFAREMEEMRKKVQLNGHFKDILPPKV